MTVTMGLLVVLVVVAITAIGGFYVMRDMIRHPEKYKRQPKEDPYGTPRFGEVPMKKTQKMYEVETK